MIENLESVYFVNLASMEFHITHKKKKKKKEGTHQYLVIKYQVVSGGRTTE